MPGGIYLVAVGAAASDRVGAPVEQPAIAAAAIVATKNPL